MPHREENSQKKKSLKEEVFALKNAKRSGAWVGDSQGKTLVKAPKTEQKAHKKKLRQKIKDVRQEMRGL